MIPILDLWLPILASAVFVFVMSAILHMVINYHASDFRKLPQEDSVLASLRAAGVTPGMYHFPYCKHGKEMQAPAMVEKMKQGPIGIMTVLPSGPPAMGKYLGLWFLYTVLVAVFVAYLAGRTLAHGAIYLAVFRFAATVAFMAYGIGPVVDSIWKGQPWSATAKSVFDGLIYALLTGGAFGWLWPR